MAEGEKVISATRSLRGGRRHGAGRKKGSKNKPKTAAPIVAEFEAGILPLDYMQREMERFIGMGTEEAAREARTIAISIMRFKHPQLAAKQVHSIHDVGDRLSALLQALDGRPTNKISGAMGRPALAAQQLVLDHGQGRAEGPVQIELGAGNAPERNAHDERGAESPAARLHDTDPIVDA
jgi:hypothetical protein